MQLERLKDRFPAEDIEWRIARAGYSQNGNLYGTVLAYITNRAIQHRLDEVCGPANWRNEFREWNVGGKSGVLCGISIKIDGEWVTKWDGAENTDVEPLKGGLSDSMKRAGVQWGIGRYLYNLEENFAVITEHGKYFASGKDKTTGKAWRFKWNPPALPLWAMPAATTVTQPAKELTPLRPKTPAIPVSAGDRQMPYTIGPAPAGKRP